MSIDQIYTELIMEHNKSGHNRHEIDHPDGIERGHNPNCGDDLTLLIHYDGDIVSEASFLGHGCAISQASMSIMIDLVKGKPVSQAQAMAEAFFKMIKKELLSDQEIEALEDAAVFENLSNMPARVKCGTLGWHCLKVVLERKTG